jgi:signal transduction histidine kinase
MLISTSSEFEALCRQQMALLTLQLGASLSVVYLTQELVEPPANEAKLVPVIVYPETGVLWQDSDDEAATGRKQQYLRNTASLLSQQRLLTAGQDLRDASLNSDTAKQTESQGQSEYLLSGDQIVLPLIYENLMMGLLVTNREDRVWSEQERNQIERIAQTIALACILEQRKAWLEVQLQEQQIFQEKQQDLLDNLLHQLRNPLTALRTFGKLLVKRLLPGDSNSEVAKSIVRESDRLEELLLQFDKIIDLTPADFAAKKLPQKEVVVEASVKTEEDTLLLPGSGEQLTSCTVESVLKPLLVSSLAIAQERNLHLTIKIPDNLPTVRANVKALTEVLSNILDNALKYTPSGGKIFIEAGKEKPGFQGIAISDTGPGIPSQDLEHLGERYYRGVQAQTEIPGSGLGISIAKQLIEQMQGLLEVISPAISDAIKLPNLPGTTFIVWLVISQ